jgi:hypothetical protein
MLDDVMTREPDTALMLLALGAALQAWTLTRLHSFIQHRTTAQDLV